MVGTTAVGGAGAAAVGGARRRGRQRQHLGGVGGLHRHEHV